MNHHVQRTVFGAVGCATDEQGTGFPLLEKEAEKQIQGHARGREINAKVYKSALKAQRTKELELIQSVRKS